MAKINKWADEMAVLQTEANNLYAEYQQIAIRIEQQRNCHNGLDILGDLTNEILAAVATGGLSLIADNSVVKSGTFFPLLIPISLDITGTIVSTLENAGKEIENGLNNVSKEIEKGFQNIGTEIEIGVQNSGKTIEKFANDLGKELERAGQNIGDAAEATEHFIENQLNAYGQTLTDAAKRIEEGKIVDAIWHTAIDPFKHTDDNFAKAVTESSLLNNIATAAASIYGGPQGAAAYAAWYTYKQTGDINVALKAGVIAGLTSKGIQIVNGMPATTVSEITKRTLASASIGAAAIAASGGSEEDIIEGFLKGAALTGARLVYKSMTTEEIEGRAPTKGPLPKLDFQAKGMNAILFDKDGNPAVVADLLVDKNGNPTNEIDITTLSREYSHVGLAYSSADNSINAYLFSEKSPLMISIAKLPYFNDMGYFHDQWAATAALGGGTLLVVTIIPAYILTAAGGDTIIIDQATEENTEGHN